MKLKILIAAALMNMVANGQEDHIIDSSYFLAVDDSLKCLVTFKSKTFAPDEYHEGFIEMFNTQTKKKFSLDSSQQILEFIDVEISNKDLGVFYSTGKSITRVDGNFLTSRKIYTTKKKQSIVDFSLSDEGRFLAITLKKIDSVNVFETILFDIESQVVSSIYIEAGGANDEQPETDQMFFCEKKIYFLNLQGNIISYDLSTNKADVLDTSVLHLFKIDKDKIAFSKGKELIQFDQSAGSRMKIIDCDESLVLSYVGKYQYGLVICLNDNVYFYDYKSRFESLKFQKGKYLYVTDLFSIREFNKPQLLILSCRLPYKLAI